MGGIPWHQEPLGCWSLVAPVVQGSCVGQSPPVGQPTTAFFSQANGRRHHPTLRGFKQAEILLGFFQKATVRRHHHVAQCIRAQVWLWQLALVRRGRISSGDEHVSRAVGALAVSQPALNNIMGQLTRHSSTIARSSASQVHAQSRLPHCSSHLWTRRTHGRGTCWRGLRQGGDVCAMAGHQSWAIVSMACMWFHVQCCFSMAAHAIPLSPALTHERRGNASHPSPLPGTNPRG